jgi:sugar lactone lactonase YvrE
MSPNHDTADRIDHTRRTVLRAVSLAGLVGLGSGSALATSGDRSGTTPSSASDSSESFPDILALPDGFQPEGITTGRGDTFFVGSLASGDVYRGDLRTGEGEVLVDAAEDRVAIGLSHDQRSNNVFAAGGGTGKAFVYDGDTGDAVEAYDLTDPGTFVNDVVVTREAAYFTDSFRSAVYRLPLGPAGRLPDQDAVEELTLGGEFEAVDGFNANGIDAAPNTEYLVIVNSTTGLLYKVDPESGEATEIDLGGETVANGDGILLDGTTLYVVRNRNNLIAEIDLESDATAGEIVDEITDEAFDVPTTVAAFGNDLYAVNARFGVEKPGSAEYDVIRTSK